VTASAGGKEATIIVQVTITPSKEKTRRIKVAQPAIRIEEVSETSLVTLSFDSPIIVYDKPHDAFMIDPRKFLKFEVIKNPVSSYYEEPKYIESGQVLSMSIKSFTPKQIKVQLELSNPLYISLDALNRDKLKVTIIDDSSFISAVDFLTTAALSSSS